MPLYAYRCSSCESEFDARRSISERDDSTCPECGAKATRQIATISVTGNITAEPAGGCGPEMCAMRQEAGMPCSMAS